MGLNAIETTENIRQAYIQYLKSMFFFRNKELKENAIAALEKEQLLKGPYIEITPPFETGKTIQTLIDEGVLCKGFERLKDHFKLDMNLYLHQQQALEKISVEKKNAVVATGTGSGKTECFMLPIINELINQDEKGQLGPGVRALLLYPMNALANDQLKRLRKILADYPAIKFGRYTGETKEKRKEAEEEFALLNPGQKPLSNELLSREEMRKTPPHILITNYAMLEYLLLRPKDIELFENGETWKYIVLDEAHTYFGAQGTEISMLLRRLKDRIVQGARGKIQCIATSATLGSGREDYPQVAKFAEGLFNEPFSPQDIIESTRLPYRQKEDAIALSDEAYHELFKISKSWEDDAWKLEALQSLLDKECIVFDAAIKDWKQLLYQVLKRESIIIGIQQRLKEGALPLETLASEMDLPEGIKEPEKFITQVVDLAVKAKEGKEEMPLLPARYHTFVRATEGAFVAFLPNKAEVYLKRKKFVNAQNVNYKVFELGNCKKCGQEYLLGRVTDDMILEQVDGKMDPDTLEIIQTRYFMLGEMNDPIDYDEDEMDSEVKAEQMAHHYELCICCGKLREATQVKKEKCCKNAQYIKVNEIQDTQGKATKTCSNCAGRGKDIIKRFLTADDTSTEILARELYQNIPPEIKKAERITSTENDWWVDEEDTIETYQDETSRKLLVFSDSRSEAAYFATFMDYRYTNYLWRKIGLEALDKLDEEEISLDSWARQMAHIAEKHHIVGKDESFTDIKADAYLHVMKEFIALEDIGLQGIGQVGFYLPEPSWWRVPAKICDALKATKEEVWLIFATLLDSLRGLSAITFPDEVSPEDEEFAPRNRNVYFKQVKGKDEYDTVGWLPSKNFNNRRSDFLRKVLLKAGHPNEAAKALSHSILEEFIILFDKLKKEDYFTEVNLGTKGVGLKLNSKKFRVKGKHQTKQLYRCTKCGKMTTYNVKGVCPAFRCKGELVPYQGETTRLSYYKDLYENVKLIPLKIEEHTAQLSNVRAADLQNQFEKGKVNILSCSTTFEMGVDVGQLEAVFMRNVPPETANYIQRAGRAGRRTESTAYSLTFAKRRSHDIHYFNTPRQIISGQMKPPYIEENNAKIVKRHLHSVVFAWFFRKYEEYFDNVESLIRYDLKEQSVDIVLGELLEKRPPELLASLKHTIPQGLQKELGIDNWAWVEELFAEDGYLACAKSQYYATLEELEKIITDRSKKGQMIDSYVRTKNTYRQKTALDFLARNSIIPRYGFPIDSVNLDIRYHGIEASQVELSRDLKMAISEFAPSSEVIAAGKLWRSYRINKNPQKSWPTFYYAHCNTCHKTYKYHSDLKQHREELFETTSAHPLCECGKTLNYIKYIQPIFGFSTGYDKPKKPLGRKNQHYYSTQVYFHNYSEEPYAGMTEIGKRQLNYNYSSKGQLFLVNRGSQRGFSVCNVCGYGTDNKEEKTHYSAPGVKCKSTNLYPVALGHEFMTDILELQLPPLYIEGPVEKVALSLLYTIVEGAARALGISKREINGCLNYNHDRWPSIILYDEIPGGVGHVKHIAQNLKKVLEKALESVSGICGCEENVSCYGCIKNYSNQLHHEKLERGLAKAYLEQFLNK